MTQIQQLSYHGDNLGKLLIMMKVQYANIHCNPFIPWWKKIIPMWRMNRIIRKIEKMRIDIQQQINVEYFKSLKSAI